MTQKKVAGIAIGAQNTQTQTIVCRVTCTPVASDVHVWAERPPASASELTPCHHLSHANTFGKKPERGPQRYQHLSLPLFHLRRSHALPSESSSGSNATYVTLVALFGNIKKDGATFDKQNHLLAYFHIAGLFCSCPASCNCEHLCFPRPWIPLLYLCVLSIALSSLLSCALPT